MATYRIYEFGGRTPADNLQWPATHATEVNSGSSLVLASDTTDIIVTADADGRIEIGSLLTVGNASLPIVAAAPNPFRIAQTAQRASVFCQ